MDSFFKEECSPTLAVSFGNPRDQPERRYVMSSVDEIRALAKAALHPTTSLAVKYGFLQLYSDAVRKSPLNADDEHVFKLVARTARDVHLNSVARQNALTIIETFLNRVPHWANSTVAEAVMKKVHFIWEGDVFETLKEKRPDLVPGYQPDPRYDALRDFRKQIRAASANL
jgi:hypothetical protein